MRREFSAGGVLVRRLRGEWVLAAIRPAGKPRGVWVLPKGQIDEGESGPAAAVREVAEETGVHGRSSRKLGDDARTGSPGRASGCSRSSRSSSCAT